MADQMQIYKYCIPPGRPHLRQEPPTFMPKPVYGDNGSGHALPPVDLEGRQAGIRRQQICRSFGDLPVLQSPASSSMPRRSTPSPIPRPISYKRLVPGYEAPGAARLLGAQTARRRAAFPYTHRQSEGQARSRFPFSPIRWPIRYLGFAAMLMAGLDGVKNKLDPGPAMDKDLLRFAEGKS